jgi:hypothetical protein
MQQTSSTTIYHFTTRGGRSVRKFACGLRVTMFPSSVCHSVRCSDVFHSVCWCSVYLDCSYCLPGHLPSSATPTVEAIWHHLQVQSDWNMKIASQIYLEPKSRTRGILRHPLLRLLGMVCNWGTASLSVATQRSENHIPTPVIAVPLEIWGSYQGVQEWRLLWCYAA